VELDPEAGRLRILVTGSAGFIAGYLVEELLREGHEVVGVDNYSKYGRSRRAISAIPATRSSRATRKDAALAARSSSGLRPLRRRRARIGGHLVLPRVRVRPARENERIIAASFDAAIAALARGA
jgi:nucleoside-diphosphate-sugar epimerase